MENTMNVLNERSLTRFKKETQNINKLYILSKDNILNNTVKAYEKLSYVLRLISFKNLIARIIDNYEDSIIKSYYDKNELFEINRKVIFVFNTINRI